VTRAAGKIQELLVRDNRPVKEGDWLAVIENHASMEDAIYLEKALERSGMDVDSLDKALLRYKELSLGDMQAAYSGLLSALRQLQGDRLLSAKNGLHPQTDSVV
jgi:multidrug efflux pump subunit AcrA (membrane-fusion protein)